MSITTHPSLGFLPSPSSGALHLGPATIHMYSRHNELEHRAYAEVGGRVRGMEWRSRHLGGVLFGCAAGALVVRRAHASVASMLDAAAPGMLLAQGIGRWGNWWNQELFGRPTKLPWALEISATHRPPGYLAHATFHPTFLYESLWDIACVGVLLWVDRRYDLRPPALFALYISFTPRFDVTRRHCESIWARTTISDSASTSS